MHYIDANKLKYNKINTRRLSMWDIIEAAGWPIWLLIYTSIFAVAIVIERFWSLRTSKVIPTDLFENLKKRILNNGPRDFKPKELEDIKKNSASGIVLSTAIANYKLQTEDLRLSIEQAGKIAANQMSKYLALLGTVGTVAPLLGLFGTIVGMVELFESFTSSGASVETFARGISIALYNTAGGIVVAVPAMIFYRYFKSNISNKILLMENQASEILNIIKK